MIPLVYDQVNSRGIDEDFYLVLLNKIDVKTIADLGCGTGRLTTKFAKQGYQITAIDPNEEAISYAKSKPNVGSITWIVGDSSNLHTAAYDAVIMTANVAQVFLTDESWQHVISDAYHALKPGGHFIFDTRNPLAKAWEEWQLDDTPDRAIDPLTGNPLEIWTSYEGFTDDVFTYYETVKNAHTNKEIIHLKMQLIFRAKETIESSLQKVGFKTTNVYADWALKQATSTANSFIFHCIK
ncbi:class I SAM-dependent methyltransferase [Solibacillus sp. MA9]|uniref:Class I SAM-dependent methyltransferase n=1 Tax=Solibacillus palustris TaxID=2908203 RepID=A0ABS9UE42_9BACL|nr:class I SAM-dependent methyltransferase [Solibacillus sp. MA9]MCH7322594.1 class I SAM-dependent methyltransferase [Solibacillus sp. MA9]